MTKKYLRKLLVATNTNGKSSMYQTVILITAESPKRGVIGLCINRMVRHICTCGECPPPPTPIFLGGPREIDRRFFFMHDQPRLAGKRDKVLDGVYLSHIDKADEFCCGNAKLITGFCQWEPGQLDEEVKKHWWHVERDPDPKLVLKTDPKRVWGELTPFYQRFLFSVN